MKMRAICILVVWLMVCGVGLANSIVFPAFSAPLVTEDVILAHHTYGNELICLNRKSCTIRWQLTALEPIQSLFRYDSNRVIALHSDKLSVIDLSRGSIIMTQNIPGSPFGCSTDGKLFSQTKDGVIACHDLETGKLQWYRSCPEPESNAFPLLADDLVFLSTSPRSITTHYENKAQWNTVSGANLISCLGSKDGKFLWREPVSLSKQGFGVHLQVASYKKWTLCITDNALRLLDGKTGKALQQWSSEEDVDGADFWGSGRVAVCLGGIGATHRTIRILNVPGFTLQAEFSVDAMEVASVQVVGDIMILQSLYHNIGVDLGSRKVIWQKWQRQYTVQGGLLYFGEFCDNKRVLGICDPRTGKDTILYSESVTK